MDEKKKKIIYIALIIIIVFLAYFIASTFRTTKKKEEVEEETIFKVGDIQVEFKLYRVNQSFFIKVPDNFTKLDDETLKTKYGTTNRPELVFEDMADITHLFITVNSMDMTEDGIPNFMEEKKKELANYEIDEITTYQAHGKTFGRVSVSDTLDTGNYYDIRYFSLNNKLVTVEFNTLKPTKEEWKQVSEEMLNSICFTEEDTKKK